jgi:uncharacterized SAM-binding protein YcdF (DUF218 family)
MEGQGDDRSVVEPRSHQRAAAPMRAMARPGGGRAIERWLRLGALLVLAATLAFVLGLAAFVVQFGRYEPSQTPHADGIVALTGGAERISEAVELLASGAAARLLVTGVNQTTTRHEIARLTPKFAEQFSCCIDLGYAALNTAGNALETQQWVHANGITSLIVVTSAFHMPRALAEIGHMLPDVKLVPYPVISDRQAGWWHDLAMVRLILFEYGKYLVALARITLVPDRSQEGAHAPA